MSGELKGWQPDPYGIHELRYFTADGKPSGLVRDGDTWCKEDTPDQSHSIGPGLALPLAEPPVAHPADWYQDPSNPGQLRYWDGVGWTHDIHPAFLVPADSATPPMTASAQLEQGPVDSSEIPA